MLQWTAAVGGQSTDHQLLWKVVKWYPMVAENLMHFTARMDFLQIPGFPTELEQREVHF